MMTKTAYYMQMAQEAAAQITGSKEQWTAFLTTSARLYKYPFAEQLMIYKQRPEATACAEYDLWKDRMNRYVKRGSKGIALLDMRGEQPKLRYVFDVADTGERKNSRPVQLWKMNAEHEQPIIRALDAAFDVPAGAGSLENHIMEAAERLARDYWEENRRQISDIVADSYLEGYDELNIGASFKESTNTAFNFLKANGNRISGSISTTMRDYIINYQDLQGIGMTGKLALPTLIALCSIALGRPTVSTLAVLGEISISGTILKVDELANSLQVCLDSGAKKVLLPITSAADLGTVPPELVGSFNLIFYSSAEDAVFKALGVE